MAHILLTAAQAERVRYMDRGKSGLNPIEQEDGTFFLGEECLADPRFGGELARLPRIDEPSPKWRTTAVAPTRQR